MKTEHTLLVRQAERISRVRGCHGRFCELKRAS
jgi:hypothetical protein